MAHCAYETRYTIFYDLSQDYAHRLISLIYENNYNYNHLGFVLER